MFNYNIKELNINVSQNMISDYLFQQLFEEYLQNTIEKNNTKTLRYDVIFPVRSHIPIENRELISDILQKLSDFFPDTMKQEIKENINKLHLEFRQQKQ